LNSFQASEGQLKLEREFRLLKEQSARQQQKLDTYVLMDEELNSYKEKVRCTFG
jgi:hypothetical protein